MKIWLILLNLLLAGGVTQQAVKLFRHESDAVEYTVGRDRSKPVKNTAARPTGKSDAMTPGEAVQLIVGANIFNLARCPDAQSGRWGGNSAQMSLLGVYRIGTTQGAIIQQKRNSGRRGPGNWRQGQGQTATAEKPLKQFLRLGESLENGYTLTAVHDDRIVLSRGGGQLELKLETASKNLPATIAAAAAAAQQNRPTAQQMQQIMMFQQMRMMNELVRNTRNNQNQNQNQNQNRQTAPGRGNTRTR